jgi:chromosome partitioning protein
MRKIVISNQKGGVGKTTVTRELGIYLSVKGFRILLVDCDPQGNLSKSLCSGEEGLYEAVNEGTIYITPLSGTLFLLAGSRKLSLLEKQLHGKFDVYNRFRELFLREEFLGYDLLLFDTPPSLGVVTINALSCGDAILIPMKASLYSMQGVNELMRMISRIKKSINPPLSVLGVIINAFNRVPVLEKQIKEEIEKAFGKKVFGTVLSKSIVLEVAIAERRGVVQLGYLARSKVKDEICALGEELLNRLKMPAGMAKEIFKDF